MQEDLEMLSELVIRCVKSGRNTGESKKREARVIRYVSEQCELLKPSGHFQRDTLANTETLLNQNTSALASYL